MEKAGVCFLQDTILGRQRSYLFLTQTMHKLVIQVSIFYIEPEFNAPKNKYCLSTSLRDSIRL
jgi:hypothetical protein